MLVDCTRHVGWPEFAGRDASIYAAVARYWEQGLMPYRDVYDFKPPLIYVALRVGYVLWGYEAEALRRVLMIVTTAGALILYLGLRRAGALTAAPVAAFGLVSLIIPFSWSFSLQNTEPLVVAFGAAAFGCAAAHQHSGRWWWAVAAGACVGLAALGKQPGLLLGVPVLVQLWLWQYPNGWSRRLSYAIGRAVLAGAGFAIVAGIVAAYFAWHGAFLEMYQAVLVDSSMYAGARPRDILTLAWWVDLTKPSTNRVLFWAMLERPFWPFVVSGFLLIVLTLLRPSRWLLVAWLGVLVGFVMFNLGGRAYWHYVVMTYPVLALTVAIVCELIFGKALATGTGRNSTYLFRGLVLSALIYGNTWWADYLPRTRVQQVPAPVDAAAVLGRQIAAVSEPGDTLFVEGEPFSIYAHAGVAPATRFIYENPPRREALSEREQALRNLPDFLVLTIASDQRTRDAAARAANGYIDLLATILTDHYQEWVRSPAGIAYRRHGRTGDPPRT
jgi:4-amino-4-deoxy-L-arabinose transferase-like glycosyltransferase